MKRKHNSERGQTILLVAVSLVTLLGLAALAIDVVTLYVARSETQRAADAAALAGAKTLVDSGLTTDPCNAALASSAINLATNDAQLAAAQNVIAGQAPPAGNVTVTFPNGASPSCVLATPSPFGINPQVKVVVLRTGLPTFFARVWNRGLGSVSATAVAEAYNPSNSGSLNATGNVIPIAPRCVKPMILPNCDPLHTGSACGGGSATFITPATGQITNPGQYVVGGGGVINEPLTVASTKPLRSACPFGSLSCATPNGITAGRYYPLMLPTSAQHLCPAGGTCNSGATGFELDTECCNFPSPGNGVTCGQQFAFDPSTNPEQTLAVQNGLRCMIHDQGGGQDTIDTATNSPTEFIAGDNNPFVGTSVQAGDHIVNSDSIATVPIFDQTTITPPITAATQFTVIGFLQLFISTVHNNGRIDAYILNVSGCGNTPAGTAVQGSGTPVPVRLIQP